MRLRWLAAVFVLACCFSDAPPRNVGSVVGRWRTETFVSQFGRSVSEYCFDSTGHFAASFQSEGPSASDAGTYRLEGNRLILTGSNGSSEYTVVPMTRRRFTLLGNDDDRTYHLVDETCSIRRKGDISDAAARVVARVREQAE